MKIGMTLPVTEPGWNRDILLQWVERIEAGPFHSIALGERTCFPSPEIMTTLAAVAALTKRLRIIATVLVLPAHQPVVAAKQLATIDLISDGRLRVGVGTGGREEDYHAAGVSLDNKRIATMEQHIGVMRQVWAGDYMVGAAGLPVGPEPVQAGGPPLLAGVFGPKGLASAARWAAGVTGMSMSAGAAEAAQAMAQVEAAWQTAGRAQAPEFSTAFWFAVGSDADSQMYRHLHRYFNWLDDASREGMAAGCGFRGSVEQLSERLRAFAATGADELLLIPTAIDPSQVDLAIEAVRGM